MKRCVSGLRVRFFRVVIPTGGGCLAYTRKPERREPRGLMFALPPEAAEKQTSGKVADAPSPDSCSAEAMSSSHPMLWRLKSGTGAVLQDTRNITNWPRVLYKAERYSPNASMMSACPGLLSGAAGVPQQFRPFTCTRRPGP